MHCFNNVILHKFDQCLLIIRLFRDDDNPDRPAFVTSIALAMYIFFEYLKYCNYLIPDDNYNPFSIFGKILFYLVFGLNLMTALFGGFILMCDIFCPFVSRWIFGNDYILFELPQTNLPNIVSADIGLRNDEFSQLEIMKFEENGNNADSCCICLDNFENEEMLALLPQCRHFFHINCIEIWLIGRLTCPICRRDVRKALNIGLNVFENS
jgi:hypothetical protein